MTKEASITIPENQSLEGIFEIRMAISGHGNYYLNTTGQRIPLYQLEPGKFNIKDLETLNPGSLVQVTGFINYNNEVPVLHVDKFVVLKAGHVKQPVKAKDPLVKKPFRPKDPDILPEKPERPVKKPIISKEPIHGIPEQPLPQKPHMHERGTGSGN